MAVEGLNNVIRSAGKKETVKLPDFSKLKNGLVKIGYNDKPSGFYEDLYVYVRDGKPFSYLRCGRAQELENPGCDINQIFNEHVDIGIRFSIKNLDWYTQGGIDKINDLIKSWVKSN